MYAISQGDNGYLQLRGPMTRKEAEFINRENPLNCIYEMIYKKEATTLIIKNKDLENLLSSYYDEFINNEEVSNLLHHFNDKDDFVSTPRRLLIIYPKLMCNYMLIYDYLKWPDSEGHEKRYDHKYVLDLAKSDYASKIPRTTENFSPDKLM